MSKRVDERAERRRTEIEIRNGETCKGAGGDRDSAEARIEPMYLPSENFWQKDSFFGTMSPVQMPRQLRTLDDLLAQAEHYANYCMRNTGRVTPALFLLGPDGPLMLVPESLADESAKDDFANNARLMCIAHGATAVVMVLEAWAKFATPGEKFDMTEPPSEAFDRREVVVLMGESRDGPKQKFLPIIRSGNGKFFGFGESDVPVMDQMTGRFAQILPPKVPDDEMRLVAKAMLKVKGVTPAKRQRGDDSK